MTKINSQKITTTAIGVTALLLTFVAFGNAVYATNDKSPYDSGYDHGCSDAGKSPDDRYINEDGKGPSNHTDEFMNGYNAGYNNCSGSDNSQEQTASSASSSSSTSSASASNVNNICIFGPCQPTDEGNN